ncbi:uncharacterized protein LOC143611340 [Bidens hawaiensis]|uniref:uncharacterized protein LOC143611340 n=1 Tax=Bidens hawaiensis TaxID=980011 RepID=UPI00404A5A66
MNEDFLMEMVLMDEDENRMQATVYKQDIFCFKRFLKENATLTIVNPSIDLNGSNYRVIDYLIVHVVHVFKSNFSNVKHKNKRTMKICDSSGNCVYFTLRDHYAFELSKYVIDHFDEGQAIIVPQFGRKKVYMSNSFGSNVSCLFINDFLFEIEEYKNSLLGLLNANDIVVRKSIPVKMLSSVDVEFLKPTELFNISYEYHYPCRKLMENNGEGGKEYECKIEICNVLGVLSTPRFKIKIRVQDLTGVVSLTLSERDAKMLINKIANEKGGFSADLNCLLEKKFTFKVDVADFNFRNNVEDYGINKLPDESNYRGRVPKRPEYP